MTYKISEIIRDSLKENEAYLHFGKAYPERLLLSLQRAEKTDGELYDEQLWTFLVAIGYSADGSAGVRALSKLLTGDEPFLNTPTKNEKIWLEVLPTPPRKKEGCSNIDLALGTIRLRGKHAGGIELADKISGSAEPWACFCEMKWYSDISVRVRYDPRRNQLGRILENLAYMCPGGKKYFVLVAPEKLLNDRSMPRFYHYKFNEYIADPANIAKDLDAVRLEQADSYPENIGDILARIKLRKVSYEKLFDSLPDTELRGPIQEFVKDKNKCT